MKTIRMSVDCQANLGNATAITTERWVTTAAVIASGMAFIDATALNVALPMIQSEFGATGSQLLWIVNAYALMVAALLLLGGALGDHFGHRRMLMTGVGLFAVGSLLCGLAPGAAWLIAARTVQGIGAAIMLPGSLSLISTTFEPLRRGRAIGTWSALSVVMTALGPVLGGVLADAGLWRCVFLINLPLAALCLLVLRAKVPAGDRQGGSGRLDFGGGLLSVAGLALLSYGLIESSNRGWQDPGIVAAMAAAVVCLGAFVLFEQRVSDPLLPMSLFRDRTMVAASVQTLCLYSGLFGMTFFLSLNLIQVQQYAAAQAGLAQLPLMLMVLMFAPVAGRLVDRAGPRIPITIGGALGGAGFALLAAPHITSGPGDYWFSFLLPLILLGVSMGVSAPALSTAILNSVEQTRLGAAAGVNSTLSRLSSVLGIAVLGPVALLVFRDSLMSLTTELALNSSEVAQLARESVRLADAQPPAGLSAELTSNVDGSISAAYVTAFRVVSIVCAAIVGLSTLGVAVLMGGKAAR